MKAAKKKTKPATKRARVRKTPPPNTAHPVAAPYVAPYYDDPHVFLPEQVANDIARADIAHAYAYGPGSDERHYKEVLDEIYNAFEKFKTLQLVLLAKLRARR